MAKIVQMVNVNTALHYVSNKIGTAKNQYYFHMIGKKKNITQ